MAFVIGRYELLSKWKQNVFLAPLQPYPDTKVLLSQPNTKKKSTPQTPTRGSLPLHSTRTLRNPFPRARNPTSHSKGRAQRPYTLTLSLWHPWTASSWRAQRYRTVLHMHRARARAHNPFRRAVYNMPARARANERHPELLLHTTACASVTIMAFSRAALAERQRLFFLLVTSALLKRRADLYENIARELAVMCLQVLMRFDCERARGRNYREVWVFGAWWLMDWFWGLCCGWSCRLWFVVCDVNTVTIFTSDVWLVSL